MASRKFGMTGGGGRRIERPTIGAAHITRANTHAGDFSFMRILV